MSKKYRQPWYTSCRWTVEAQAVRDAPSGGASRFKKGEWIAVYCAANKPAAKKLAKDYGAELKTRTRVVPGEGHKTRRGF